MESALPQRERIKTVWYLHDKCGCDWAHSIEVERAIFAYSANSQNEYVDKSLQICYNMRVNPALNCVPPRHVVAKSNAELAENTVLARVQAQERAREMHYTNLLQAKADKGWKEMASILKCRNCKSSDISWQQKQTRGADEAMTIFCTCNSCKARWKMS